MGAGAMTKSSLPSLFLNLPFKDVIQHSERDSDAG